MTIMKYVLTTLFLIGQLTMTYSQNWELDFNTALKTAQDSNKTIILVFSGSDWCAPCIKLEREIWETDIFQRYANEHYVMVRADFPSFEILKLEEVEVVLNEGDFHNGLSKVIRFIGKKIKS